MHASVTDMNHLCNATLPRAHCEACETKPRAAPESTKVPLRRGAADSLFSSRIPKLKVGQTSFLHALDLGTWKLGSQRQLVSGGAIADDIL